MKSILTSFLLLGIAAGAFAQSSCESPAPAEVGTFNVAGLTGEFAGYACNGVNLANGAAWYAFTPTTDMGVTISSNIAPTQDTRLFVFSGDCNNLQCEGYDDDSGGGYSSILTLEFDANVTYYIVWDAFWSAEPFSFSITETVIVPSLIEFTTQNLSIFAAAGSDFNGDGRDDVLEVSGNQINVALQQENGTFTPAAYVANSVVNPPSWSLTTGDLNDDGQQDIVCGGGSGVSILLSQTGSNQYTEFTVTDYVFSQRGNCVDLDADGLLDVFMCHDVAPNVRFMNNGNGTFNFSQGGLGDTPDGGNYGSVWIDYDNDCDMDLFIAKCRGGMSEASRNQLHRNNGDGTFTDVSLESGLADYVQTWSSAWGDFDNDGDMDAVVGASSFSTGHHKVMRNNGDGTFSDVTEGSGWDTFFGTSIEYQPADFNNDGLVDVIGGGNYIAVNNGNFNFTLSPAEVGSGCIGDFNSDGFMDVASGNMLFINEGNDNNFIKVITQGTESNSDGIGARVTIFTEDGAQIRDIRSGEGFRHMSSSTAHFGIGEQTAISKIEICWPSGIMDEIFNPEINTTIIAVEGENSVSVQENQTTSFEIFPNPVEDVLTVSLENNNAPARVEIFDINGRLVINQTLQSNQIDVSQLSGGIYTVKLISNNEVATKKVYKK
ncbi:MAG: FG-GAP-like repeat-containing protein [Flavobacteriales bacterium]|jgi:hypothetical protein